MDKRTATQSAPAPGGWRLVPEEPTAEMLETQARSRPDLAKNKWTEELAKKLNEFAREDAARIYREMISASPAPEPVADVVEAAAIAFADHAFWGGDPDNAEQRALRAEYWIEGKKFPFQGEWEPDDVRRCIAPALRAALAERQPQPQEKSDG